MQPQSLSPDRAILSNVIGQGEKVRVGEKGGGFMLVIERTSISHRPFKGLCPTGAVPSRNCREATGSALLSGRWEREFQGPCHPIFAGPYLSIREEGDGVRSEAAFSSTTTCVSDLFSLVLEDGRRGYGGGRERRRRAPAAEKPRGG